MDFCPSKLKRPLLIAVMSVLAASAGAQQSGQPIIFSSPQTGDSESVTPSLVPQNPQLLTLPDALQAPTSIFNNRSSNVPQPPPPANTSDQQRMNKLLEERKNWMLMTPTEMFGVASTGKMLQPTERDAMGRENNSSQLERYLDRESASRTGSTNGWQNNNDRGNLPWGISRDHNNNILLNPGRDSTRDSKQDLIRLLNRQQNPDVSPDQDSRPSWSSFSTPPALPATKPNLEQLAAMERFRELLQPNPAPAADPSPNNNFFQMPKTDINPNFTQPDFVPNPAGASFRPLTDGIGKPVGLTPLPGIATPPPPVTTPKWAPKPPPWLSQTPQPFVIPQRSF